MGHAKIDLAFPLFSDGGSHQVYFIGYKFADNYAPQGPPKTESKSRPPTYFFQNVNFVTAKINRIRVAELHGWRWGIVDAYPD